MLDLSGIFTDLLVLIPVLLLKIPSNIVIPLLVTTLFLTELLLSRPLFLVAALQERTLLAQLPPIKRISQCLP